MFISCGSPFNVYTPLSHRVLSEQQQGVERREPELHQDSPPDERRRASVLQPPSSHQDRPQHGLHLHRCRSSGLSQFLRMSKITTTSYSGVDPGWFKVRRDLCRHLKGTAVEGGQLAGAEEHGQHEDGDHRGDRGGGSIHPQLAISPPLAAGGS